MATARRARVAASVGMSWPSTISMVGALANFTLAILTYALLRESIAARAINERSLVEANRAWVAPVGVSLEEDIQVGKSAKYLLEFKNIGREPALGVNLVHRVGPATRQSIDEFWTLDESGMVKCDNTLSNGVLYPTDQQRGQDFSLPKEYATAKMLKGLSSFYVQGCIQYRTFNEIHWAAFCWILDARPDVASHSWGWDLCPSGNFAN